MLKVGKFCGESEGVFQKKVNFIRYDVDKGACNIRVIVEMSEYVFDVIVKEEKSCGRICYLHIPDTL